MSTMIGVFQDILQKLNNNKIEYMIVGSLAAMIYGEPRLTKDMDVVVQIPPTLGPHLRSIFPEDKYYLPPPEIINQEIVRRGQFNLIDFKSGLKVDFVVRKTDDHAIAEFMRRKEIEILPTIKAFVATPEDVIIRKLLYYRDGGSEKHIEDTRSILAGTAVDVAYIENWVTQMGLDKAWQKTSV